MKTLKNIFTGKTVNAVILALVIFISSCKKLEEADLNAPSTSALENATIADLNSVVVGTESAIRDNYYFFIDDAGLIGREFYRYSSADPRYTQDLLSDGSLIDNNTFYINNPWQARYRDVKNCNILIEAANSSTFATSGQKSGYIGFAKTIKAYQLLLNLNLTYNNGIRVDVNDPENLGGFLSKDESLNAIAALLEEAKTSLSASDVEFTFSLSSGFSGFDDPAGFLKFNRALAARVAVYRQQWNSALDFLNESFFDLNGDFNIGPNMIFSAGTGDQDNNLFFPPDASGEVRVAHPSFAAGTDSVDDRLNKTPLRTDPAVLGATGLSSDRDVLVYSSIYDDVAIIRNEELILIYIEANIQTGNTGDAITALNDKIRIPHGLAAYSGGTSQSELIDEMLKQRRYSLFFEGHRWIDMRRYNKLTELPIDRTGDGIAVQFPIPFSEQ